MDVLHAGFAVRSSDAEPHFAGVLDGSSDRTSDGNAVARGRGGAIYRRRRKAQLANAAARRSGAIRHLLLSERRAGVGLRKRSVGDGAASERGVSLGGDGAVEVAATEARARRAIARGSFLVDRLARIGPSAMAGAPVLFAASGI